MSSVAANKSTDRAAFDAALSQLASRATASGLFGAVRVENGRLVCPAKNAAAPAAYRLDLINGTMWLSMVTGDRWLSESVETDLMHNGDDLRDLLEDELVDQDSPITRLDYEHFRSDDKLFTFRSALPVAISAASDAKAIDAVYRCLLGYEACFRRLGDMDAGEEGE